MIYVVDREVIQCWHLASLDVLEKHFVMKMNSEQFSCCVGKEVENLAGFIVILLLFKEAKCGLLSVLQT